MPPKGKGQEIRDLIRAAHEGSPSQRAGVGNMRAHAVVDAFAEPVTIGRIHIAAVEHIPDGVEVWLDRKAGPPDYRIFNPPTLVSDPEGDIVVRDRRYREDPLAALAEAIAMTRQPEQKGRRR